MKFRILGLCAAAMILVGFQTSDAAAYDQRKVATVLGAVTGGIIGSQIGRDDGKAVATVVGTLIGAVIGSEIDRDRRQTTNRGRVRAPVYVDDGDRWRRHKKWNKRKIAKYRRRHQSDRRHN